jgi:hypothetical protein
MTAVKFLGWVFAFGLLHSVGMAADLCSSNWSDFQIKIKSSENRLAFHNPDGPLGIGTCWWHSRFQRNANYLMDFRPQAQKLTENQVWETIRGMFSAHAVYAVNGYANLQEFSSKYAEEITEGLVQWQIVETLFELNWLNGLRHGGSTSPADMALRMDDLYDRVKNKKEIVYQILKKDEIGAHAWLVVDMIATRTGYFLEAVDSNSSYLVYRFFEFGSDHLGRDPWKFVPYTQRTLDLDHYQQVIQETCQYWGLQSALTPRH